VIKVRPDVNNCATCKQCGEYKPISKFRKYRGGRRGYYNYCTSCESINNRYKYLIQKYEKIGDESTKQQIEDIEKLYKILESKGYTVYGLWRRHNAEKTAEDNIKRLLNKFNEGPDVSINELRTYYKMDFYSMSEDELEELQAELMNKYCPVIDYELNEQTGIKIPIRDKSIYDKYDGLFEKIMNKIDDALGY
jgi:hypothetical protein